MKRILHIPLLLLTVLQLIILFYFFKYDAVLATTVKLLLATTAFYSVCISIYARLFLTAKQQKAQWILAILIVLTTFIKVYAQAEWINWFFIGLLYLIQIQHLFYNIQSKFKIGTLISGIIIFIILLINYLNIVQIPFYAFLMSLFIYTVFVLLTLFQKTQNT
ncbi:MAG TPA: hypothetical protein PLP27_12315 [Crocinitomicaceae bacterium]|nr:hypothetical protein [Crocinitomicaceae bacterium]